MSNGIPLSQAAPILPPILKWPGGKERELGHILPAVPRFERYFEPFVGGGAVFMAVRAGEYFVNDLSAELMALYESIARGDEGFFRMAERLDESWLRAGRFVGGCPRLEALYREFRGGELSEDGLKSEIGRLCLERRKDIEELVDEAFPFAGEAILGETEIGLRRKMRRMNVLERERGPLPEGDLRDNMEAAVKGAVYMSLRHSYNRLAQQGGEMTPERTALFLFLRNYAYSGMFRYSSKGDFNVPYGGIAYNGKLLRRKLDYYRSAPVRERFAHTNIHCGDFEGFLLSTKPTEGDFIFLDPPYDTTFNAYAGNAFTRADHARLAKLLTNDCAAQWMMVVKNTDFILGLYRDKAVRISSFYKEYAVSFMNRNDKTATHLLITNY